MVKPVPTQQEKVDFLAQELMGWHKGFDFDVPAWFGSNSIDGEEEYICLQEDWKPFVHNNQSLGTGSKPAPGASETVAYALTKLGAEILIRLNAPPARHYTQIFLNGRWFDGFGATITESFMEAAYSAVKSKSGEAHG